MTVNNIQQLTKCFETNDYNVFDCKNINDGTYAKQFVLKHTVKNLKTSIREDLSHSNVLNLISFSEDGQFQYFVTSDFKGQLLDSVFKIERLTRQHYLEYLFTIEMILSETDVDIDENSVFFNENDQFFFLPISTNKINVPYWSEKTDAANKKYRLLPIFEIWRKSFAPKPFNKAIDEQKLSHNDVIHSSEVNSDPFIRKIVEGIATLGDLKVYLDNFPLTHSLNTNIRENELNKEILWKLKESNKNALILHHNDGINAVFAQVAKNELSIEGFKCIEIDSKSLKGSKLGLLKILLECNPDFFEEKIVKKASELVKFYCRKYRIFPNIKVVKSFDEEIADIHLLLDNFIHFFSSIKLDKTVYVLINNVELLDSESLQFLNRILSIENTNLLFLLSCGIKKSHILSKFIHLKKIDSYRINEFNIHDVKNILLKQYNVSSCSDTLLKSVFESSKTNFTYCSLILNWLKNQKNAFESEKISLGSLKSTFTIDIIIEEKLRELDKLKDLIIFIFLCKKPVYLNQIESFFSNNNVIKECLDLLIEQYIIKQVDGKYVCSIDEIRETVLNHYDTDVLLPFIMEFKSRNDLNKYFDTSLGLLYLTPGEDAYYELVDSEIIELGSIESNENLFTFISYVIDQLHHYEIKDNSILKKYYLVFANISFELGKYPLALNYYKKLNESVSADLRIAECHLLMDEYGDLEKLLQHIKVEGEYELEFLRIKCFSNLYQRNLKAVVNLFGQIIANKKIYTLNDLKLFISMFNYLSSNDLKSYLDNLLESSESVLTDYIKASIFEKIGESLFNDGSFSESKEYFLSALELNRNMYNFHKVAFVENFLGMIYELKNDSKNALKHLYSATNTFEMVGEFRNSALTNSSMSIVLKNLGLIKEALASEKKALNYFKENQQFEDVVLSMTNIGHIYLTIYNYSKAELFFTNAMNLALAIRFKKGVTRSYLFLAHINTLIGNYKKSKYNLIQGLNLIENKEDENYVHYCYYKAFDLYHRGEYGETKLFLLNVFKLQLVQEYPRYEIFFKKLLAETLMKNGDYQKAESILEIILKHSIDSKSLLLQFEIYLDIWNVYTLQGKEHSSALKKLLLKQITDIESKIEDNALIHTFRESNKVTTFLKELIQ